MHLKGDIKILPILPFEKDTFKVDTIEKSEGTATVLNYHGPDAIAKYKFSKTAYYHAQQAEAKHICDLIMRKFWLE